MKYIDADKLKATIERLSSGEHPIEYERVEKLAYNRALSEIEDAIISLQQEQPEVDLEKDIEEWRQNWASPPRNEYAVFNKEDFINLARHFYELGLNTRKEE